MQKLVFGRVSGLPRECTVLGIPVTGRLFRRQTASVGPTFVCKRNSLTCGGVQNRRHFERFLRDSGCIARPQRQEFVTRSGVLLRETPLQIESIPPPAGRLSNLRELKSTKNAAVLSTSALSGARSGHARYSLSSHRSTLNRQRNANSIGICPLLPKFCPTTQKAARNRSPRSRSHPCRD